LKRCRKSKKRDQKCKLEIAQGEGKREKVLYLFFVVEREEYERAVTTMRSKCIERKKGNAKFSNFFIF